MYSPELDFDVATDMVIPPLIPNGFYHGNICTVVFNQEKLSIDWTVCLVDNGGYCDDDETEVDGNQLTYSNWLPKPGDEAEMTTSGKSTKRQAKINMMGSFIERMKFEQTTVNDILKAVQDGEYIGLEVEVQVEARVWDSNTFNSIKTIRVA